MYIRSTFYLVLLILDKGAAPQNFEIKFFKSFILLVLNGFKTWDKEVCVKLYIHTYIHIYIYIYIYIYKAYGKFSVVSK